MVWGYDKENGPANWYKSCPIAFIGKRQSPIDLIDNEVKRDSSLKPLVVSYPPFSKGKFLNNGHSVQFVPDASNNLSDLETVDKNLHFVHWDCETHASFPETVKANKRNGLCVLGFFLKVGAENAALKPITDMLPKLKKAGSSEPLAIEFDMRSVMPKDLTDYYTYDGSLTTPPLLECVKWVVFKEPLEVSAAQMEAFRAVENGSGEPLVGNYRPPCPLHSRTVAASFK
ncbi:Carbonic anhydrase 2 [Acropora cervicornis]|uniref:carbonic anhydrase n=1 Tax=Acropora cervicornis TaxID=6130 RepID=A0AAD9QM74_ACRCE|nr:Carbonic anhydrase 2 [Acropora cervicornis]